MRASEPQAFYKHLIKREACVFCGNQVSSKRRSIDHIHPQDSGGLSLWFNYAGACTSCNNHKGNKTLLEYLLCGPKGLRQIPPRAIVPLEALSVVPKGWQFPLHELLGIEPHKRVRYCKHWGAKFRKHFK